MAVYLDCYTSDGGKIAVRRNPRLFADTRRELIEFAGEIGIVPERFIDKFVPFYLLTEELGELAVESGAQRIGISRLKGIYEQYRAAHTNRIIDKGVGCPYCESVSSLVIKTTKKDGCVTRIRRCLNPKCNQNFTTEEARKSDL